MEIESTTPINNMKDINDNDNNVTAVAINDIVSSDDDVIEMKRKGKMKEEESRRDDYDNHVMIELKDARDNSNTAEFIVVKSSKWSDWLNVTNIFIVSMTIIICVSGFILGMAMAGWMKFDSQNVKLAWIEINSQILNGAFTLCAIAAFPSRILNLYRLWKYSHLCDVARGQQQATSSLHNLNSLHHHHSINNCRTETPEALALALKMEKTYEPMLLSRRPGKDPIAIRSLRVWWAIIILFNLNHLFQWPVCGFMWAYPAATRPTYLVYLYAPLSACCGGLAGTWLFLVGYDLKHHLKLEQKKLSKS